MPLPLRVILHPPVRDATGTIAYHVLPVTLTALIQTLQKT